MKNAKPTFKNKIKAKSEALKDISKYLRETNKYKSHMNDIWFDSWCVTPNMINNKLTNRLNLQLGI